MKKIIATYFDNTDYDFDLYKESFQECRELTDVEMEDVTDDEIYSFISDSLEMDYDDFFSNLQFSKFMDTPCVVTGSLGLWHGRHSIIPETFSDIEDAIKKCVENMDYCSIKQVYGHLEVTGIHHDGSNTFEIHLLNKRGIDASERIEWEDGKADLTNKIYHKAIDDYLF